MSLGDRAAQAKKTVVVVILAGVFVTVMAVLAAQQYVWSGRSLPQPAALTRPTPTASAVRQAGVAPTPAPAEPKTAMPGQSAAAAATRVSGMSLTTTLVAGTLTLLLGFIVGWMAAWIIVARPSVTTVTRIWYWGLGGAALVALGLFLLPLMPWASPQAGAAWARTQATVSARALPPTYTLPPSQTPYPTYTRYPTHTPPPTAATSTATDAATSTATDAATSTATDAATSTPTTMSTATTTATAATVAATQAVTAATTEAAAATATAPATEAVEAVAAATDAATDAATVAVEGAAATATEQSQPTQTAAPLETASASLAETEGSAMPTTGRADRHASLVTAVLAAILLASAAWEARRSPWPVSNAGQTRHTW